MTNTPWGGRVRFLFDPNEETVPKALHVSPFMDMKSKWTLRTEISEGQIHLSVLVTHPEMGMFFDAFLTLKKSKEPPLPNEHCGIRILLK